VITKMRREAGVRVGSAKWVLIFHDISCVLSEAKSRPSVLCTCHNPRGLRAVGVFFVRRIALLIMYSFQELKVKRATLCFISSSGKLAVSKSGCERNFF
jgi:hypothetical protein